jgi:hypothetical protein
VLLSQEKIKKLKENVNVSLKTMTTQKIRKKRGKSGTISRGAHREGLIELC